MKKIFWLCLLAACIAPLGADPAPAPVPAPTGASAPADDLSSDKTAEALWQHVADLLQNLQSAQSKDERANGDRQIIAATQAFMSRYPKDEHFLNAKMVWAQSADELADMGFPDAPPRAKIEAAFEELMQDPAVPKEKRAEISARRIVQAIETAAGKGADGASNWAAVDAAIAVFQKEFGDDLVFQLRAVELQGMKASGDAALYHAELQKLAADPDPQVAQVASAGLAMEKEMKEIESKPFELKFTAVDGRPVDLAQLRGKVVLIDFWATWCGPCVEEVPQIVATYQKYHAQGFEIVGISLDEDKDALAAFTKDHAMTWPQYFDGKRFDNAISSKFGIEEIPTMWLVNRQGMVVNDNARDIGPAVEKLMQAR